MSNEISKEALDSVPWGYEIKVGDGVWVKPKGAMYWSHWNPIQWEPVAFDEPECASCSSYIYALPVVLAGYELVKVGEVIPDDAKCAVKATGEGCVSYCAGHKVEARDLCWYFRPIAAPVVEPVTMPVVEPVKCPYCGREMQSRGKWYGCPNDKCGYFSPTCESIAAALALVKRTTVAPEPLRCPRCGGRVHVTEHAKMGYAYLAVCSGSNCMMRGPVVASAAEAESDFRKLTYGGKA